MPGQTTSARAGGPYQTHEGSCILIASSFSGIVSTSNSALPEHRQSALGGQIIYRDPLSREALFSAEAVEGKEGQITPIVFENGPDLARPACSSQEAAVRQLTYQDVSAAAVTKMVE